MTSLLQEPHDPADRTPAFKFSVVSSLHYRVTAPSTLLCSLRCIRQDEQSVTRESLTANRKVRITDLSLGPTANRFSRIDIDESGPLSLQYLAVVENRVETLDAARIGGVGIRSLRPEAIPYLYPSRYAPSDQLRDLAKELFGGEPTQFLQAMAVEDWLHDNIRYLSGSSNELTSADETYRNRAGVCRDFSHLGIAFCRALTIPARYVTVYAHQLEPEDFHAVFEVYLDGAWFLIDGTRRAPLNGMVRIAVGRDASDAAVATLFGSLEGVGVRASSEYAVENDQPFAPLTREDLRRDNLAFCLL
jgi:transglutaminase-like putative cysteine protease